MTLNSYVHEEIYTITVDYVKNTTVLSKFGDGNIYSHDKCIHITPQNAPNKIRTWLLMI